MFKENINYVKDRTKKILNPYINYPRIIEKKIKDNAQKENIYRNGRTILTFAESLTYAMLTFYLTGNNIASVLVAGAVLTARHDQNTKLVKQTTLEDHLTTTTN